ncbi:MAG: septum formation protein Maf [Lachnospiraceae bacterium]|nr:septum formation protein Maf [Lachnospiraceae bacterium]
MVNKKIILASASPRRRELLSQIGMDFEVRVSDASESAVSYEPSELVKALSALKASAVFDQLSKEEKEESLVIGADTVVSLSGSIMGKPKDRQEAVNMLLGLQGRVHQVYTGVTFIFQADLREAPMKVSFFEKTDVSVYPMSQEEILSYVATGEPMDKAGAYAIQGKFAAYIKEINGDYNNVVGLPIGRLYQEMKKYD